MKVGILGTGFGAFHASLYQQLADVESVKIFGRDEGKLQKVTAKLQIEGTTDMDELLQDPEIELIDVCLPTNLHSQYAIEALRRGKHVFCETPVSFSLEDALALQQAERQYGKRVFVNLFMKFVPEYCYLQQAIANNTYGKLRALHLKRMTPPLWGDLGLGAIPFLMIHDLDFMTWILGTPESISVVGIPGKEHESHISAHFQYQETIVQMTGSSMMPREFPFTIGYEAVFEHGLVEFYQQDSANGVVTSMIEHTDKGSQEQSFEPGGEYLSSIRHVVDCCQNNTDTILSVDDAIASLKIVLELKKRLQEYDK